MSVNQLKAKMKISYANFAATGNFKYWKQGYQAQCALMAKI